MNIKTCISVSRWSIMDEDESKISWMSSRKRSCISSSSSSSTKQLLNRRINFIQCIKNFGNINRIYKMSSWQFIIRFYTTGCPKKHGNSATNSISSLLWISIVIPNFKSHNIIMSARVYFMKRVKDCKDESIMSPQDEQWIRTSLLCLYTVIFLFY